MVALELGDKKWPGRNASAATMGASERLRGGPRRTSARRRRRASRRRAPRSERAAGHGAGGRRRAATPTRAPWRGATPTRASRARPCAAAPAARGDPAATLPSRARAEQEYRVAKTPDSRSLCSSRAVAAAAGSHRRGRGGGGGSAATAGVEPRSACLVSVARDLARGRPRRAAKEQPRPAPNAVCAREGGVVAARHGVGESSLPARREAGRAPGAVVELRGAVRAHLRDSYVLAPTRA